MSALAHRQAALAKRFRALWRARSQPSRIVETERRTKRSIAALKAAGARDVGTQSVSLSQVLGQDGQPSGFAASNVVSATVDLRVGGSYHVHMRNAEGGSCRATILRTDTCKSPIATVDGFLNTSISVFAVVGE